MEPFHRLKPTDFEKLKNDLRHCLPPPSLKRGVAIAGLPMRASTFIGRKNELERLRTAWNSTAAGADPEQKTNVFVLHAIGGAGKSALLQEFLHSLNCAATSEAHTVFAWSAYSQGSGDNRTANADECIAKALKFFGHDLERDPIQNSVERGRKLARLAGERRALVILDGVEPLQDAPHINDGRLKDRGLSEFIQMLARNNKGLLLITSRQEFPELAKSQAPHVIFEALDRMGTTEGVKLLEALGVHGKRSEMECAVEEVQGHALSLNLLGSYLSKVHAGDVNQREQFRLGEIEDVDADFAGDLTARYAQGVARILEGAVARFEALENGTNAPARTMIRRLMAFLSISTAARAGIPEIAILYMVGLFDRPAEPEALQALRAEPVIPGLTEAFAGLSEAQRDARWNVAVGRLRQLKLLAAENPNEPGGLDAHPIVRAHFGARFKALAPDAYVKAHSRLYDFYRYRDLPKAFRTPEAYGLLAQSVSYPQNARNITYAIMCRAWPPGWMETLAPKFKIGEFGKRSTKWQNLLERPNSQRDCINSCRITWATCNNVLRAITHGCAAKRHDEAFLEVYNPRVLRGNHMFIADMLGAHNANLAVIAHFYDETWCIPSKMLSVGRQSLALHLAAFSLRALGRLREAIKPFEVGLQADIAAHDWCNAAEEASNVSELRLTLGDIKAAINAARRSVAYAKEGGSEWWPYLTTLGDALHQAGETLEAQVVFEEAEARRAEREPRLPGLYGLAGYRHHDLLLAQGHAQAVIEFVTLISDVACTYALPFSLLSTAVHHLSLGRAHAALASTGSQTDPVGEHANLARIHLDNAVDGLRQAGTEHNLPWALLARAAYRRNSRDFPAAEMDLIEVYDVANRGKMRLHLTDYHLESARLALTQLYRSEAEIHYGEAELLIGQTGYKRRCAELAEIRASLDGTLHTSVVMKQEFGG